MMGPSTTNSTIFLTGYAVRLTFGLLLLGALGCSDNPMGAGGKGAGEDAVAWRQIAIDGYPFFDYACGLSDAGELYCWGSNVTGYTGSAIGEGSRVPAAVPNAPSFKAIDLSWKRGCGLTTDGRVFCWGAITSGDIDAPVTVPEPTLVATSFRFTEIATAAYYTCGLTPDGETYCWSWREGTPTRLETPVRFDRISAGSGFLCGLTGESRVFCWGANDVFQLGTGDRASSEVPLPVSGTRDFVSVSSGRERSCALDPSGRAYCWGSMSSYGGSPGVMGGRIPTAVRNGGVYSDVAVGNGHVCALTQDGRAVCWGDNSLGSLGDGTTISRATPAPVQSELRFERLAAGGHTTCGITASGAAWCWGSNGNGALGNGEMYGSGPVWEDFSPVPVRVGG